MKAFLAFTILCLSYFSNAQYYYADIIGTKETAAILRLYQQNKVSRVVLNSFDADGTKSEDFYVEQFFSPGAQTFKTITRSGATNESTLTTYFNTNGQVIKTTDSSTAFVTTTFYKYNVDGKLSSISSASKDSTIATTQTEEHKWEYEGDRILRMLKIKNGSDTSVVQFKTDDNGNIIEETGVRRGIKTEPVLYYYDGQNRLTDIVRFNNKVRRLLPVFMFEYSATNQVIQKITIPGNSSNYLIWRYQYETNGLKLREAVYNKNKQLTAKIDYQYAFANAPIP
jgi:hypothetical protein